MATQTVRTYMMNNCLVFDLFQDSMFIKSHLVIIDYAVTANKMETI